MDGGVVVERELCALVGGGEVLHAFCIFVPTVVLQGSDVEESVLAGGVVFGDVGGVEGGPAVPDFLQIGFVGRWARSFLHRGLLDLRKAGQGESEQAQGNGEKALHDWVPLRNRRNSRTGRRKSQRTRRSTKEPSTKIVTFV